VVPLFKSGDRFNPSNYRPISFRSHANKIFDKLLYNSRSSFFDQHPVICSELHGFCRGYSSALPLLKLYDQ